MPDLKRRRRGRPPKIARDVALWLCHEYFERAEGLTAWNSCLAVRDLWVRRGYRGLGGPGSHDSRAIYPRLSAAAAVLGPGETVIWPGRRFPDGIFGAGATFVPAPSRVHLDGRVITIDGPFWNWIFGRETAMFCEQRWSANSATEINFRAERRAGEMLAQAASDGQRATGSTGNPTLQASKATTLADLGITRDQSSRYQRLAAMPKADFEGRGRAAVEPA